MRQTGRARKKRIKKRMTACIAAAGMLLSFQYARGSEAGLSIAGYGSDGSWELSEEDINYRYEPAPFELTLLFDGKEEKLTKKNTASWRKLREDGVYVWDDDKIAAYLQELAKKYDTEPGKVAFTTHDGISKLFDSNCCGWHLSISFTTQRIKDAVENGQETAEPAWNSGLTYCATSDVGTSYIEVDISRQKVYMFKDGENILEADCVTGTYKTTDTLKGVFQVTGKSSPAILSDVDKSGKKYEQPVTYWVCFNQLRGQGFHDANWRGSFGGEIYKSWGSHGCVNMAEEDAKQLYQESFIYQPVIVY